MLTTKSQIKNVLKKYRDCNRPKTARYITMHGKRSGSSANSEPSNHEFLEDLELRFEFAQRLRQLNEREQRLLIMWYYECQPVAEIARRLEISRLRCYLLQKAAIKKLVTKADERGAGHDSDSPPGEDKSRTE